MEKHLPVTAAIIESVIVGIATALFIRVGGLFQILIPSASVIIILALALQKQMRVITAGYLASLLLALHSAQRTQEFQIVGALTLAIIIFELVIFLASVSFESLKNAISPIFLNGGFTFLGLLLSFAYRIRSCPPLYPEYSLPSNLLNIISPICLSTVDADENILSTGNPGAETLYYLFVAKLVIDLLTWFPFLSGALASLSETIRQRMGCSPLGWIVNYFKTTILGGVINSALTLLLWPILGLGGSYLEDTYGNATLEQLLPITQIWLVISILLFLYLFYLSLVYGWASSYRSR